MYSGSWVCNLKSEIFQKKIFYISVHYTQNFDSNADIIMPT